MALNAPESLAALADTLQVGHTSSDFSRVAARESAYNMLWITNTHWATITSKVSPQVAQRVSQFQAARGAYAGVLKDSKGNQERYTKLLPQLTEDHPHLWFPAYRPLGG